MPIGPPLKTDIPLHELTAIKEELERLRTENEALQRSLMSCRGIIRDVYEDMECLPRCDSYAHEDDCPDVNPLAAFRELRKKIAELKAERDKMKCALKTMIGMYIIDDYIYGEDRAKQIEDRFKRMVEDS